MNMDHLANPENDSLSDSITDRLTAIRQQKFNLQKIIDTVEELYQAVEEFAYVHYNHVRPHRYNGYRTPYQARIM